MTLASLFFALIALPAGDLAEPASSRGPVVLDFTATWCGPCRQMRPAVEELTRKGYPVRPVDIDQSPELAEKYKVTGVPTFVVIDRASGRELGRTSGLQPASNIAKLFLDARATLQADDGVPPGDEAPDEAAPDEPRARRVARDELERDAEGESAAPVATNPKPWQTVVRIKVHGQGSIGFGSGTVIYADSNEAVILTCAHIFKMEGRAQAQPSKFPRRITVDLFDGNLQGVKPAQVHYANETYEGKAVDYDFTRDVGLIRIKPGRRIPYARVVPAHWEPKSKMEMITVGCSEGQDATAWSSRIVNPRMKGLGGNPAYEAIECTKAPKQGRSGGGLFTEDGYVAGVCDFAEPRGDHGLYATPRSIYAILDRNKLMALYDPTRQVGASNTLVADRGVTRDDRRGVRMQSPDPDSPGSLTIPPPDMLGIKTPRVRASERLADNRAGAAANPIRRQSWHAGGGTKTTDLQLDPSLNTDRFDQGRPAAAESEVGRENEPNSTPAAARPQAEESPAPSSAKPRGSGKWRVSRSASPEMRPPTVVGSGAN